MEIDAQKRVYSLMSVIDCFVKEKGHKRRPERLAELVFSVDPNMLNYEGLVSQMLCTHENICWEASTF